MLIEPLFGRYRHFEAVEASEFSANAVVFPKQMQLFITSSLPYESKWSIRSSAKIGKLMIDRSVLASTFRHFARKFVENPTGRTQPNRNNSNLNLQKGCLIDKKKRQHVNLNRAVNMCIR
jgi:hypothetical protein